MMWPKPRRATDRLVIPKNCSRELGALVGRLIQSDFHARPTAVEARDQIVALINARRVCL